MIAASPNWRSRSRRRVFLPSYLANVDARFVAVTVFPVPPFGENTVTIRPRRPAWPPPPPTLRPEWLALRIAKTTFSVICGRRRTSDTSASSACSSRADASPEASRITGDWVCSRIAASSSSGKPELRVPWSTTCRWPPVSVAAASRTPSLQPTSSTSEWRPRASRSSARPSQLPVTKTRTFSRVVTGVSRLMAWRSFRSGTGRPATCAAALESDRRRASCPTTRGLLGYRQHPSSA